MQRRLRIVGIRQETHEQSLHSNIQTITTAISFGNVLYLFDIVQFWVFRARASTSVLRENFLQSRLTIAPVISRNAMFL
jgi:hypothetical protein